MGRALAVRWLLVVVGASLMTGCGSGTRVRVSVDHPAALWDAPLRIEVSGLRPGERTVLRARTSEWFGYRFASATPLRASAGGRVELAGEAAMRPLWSLRQTKSRTGGSTSQTSVTVTLSVDGARATLRRLFAAPGVHGVPIRHPFYGEYYAPATTGVRRPGILVFGGSEGGLATTNLAELYASHGYPSLALAYFAEPGLPRDLLRIPLEYFAGALRWLRRQPGVDPAKLAVEGISRGSEAAQLLGIHYPRLVHAVIAMVPGLGSECGIPPFHGTFLRCLGPAWTFRGQAIPWGVGLYNPFPFHDERIDGPVFLDCAGLDALWASCPMAEAIVARLHAHHFRYRVTLLAYPDAGHGVGSLYPNYPAESGLLGGLRPDSNDVAAADGWPKLLRFLAAFARSRSTQRQPRGRGSTSRP